MCLRDSRRLDPGSFDKHFEYFYSGVTDHCAKVMSLCVVNTFFNIMQRDFFISYIEISIYPFPFLLREKKRTSFDAIFGSIAAVLEILAY